MFYRDLETFGIDNQNQGIFGMKKKDN